MHRLSKLAIAILVGGCAYNADTDVSPAFDVYSNYDNKIPGRYALYVNAEKMKQDVKMSSFACSAHRFPVDAENSFKVSVERTLENLVAEIEPVDNPLDRGQIIAGNFKGLIRVEVEDLDVDLKVIPGFFSSEIEADAEITSGLTVDGATGRLLGTTVEGDEDYRADAGVACEGGAVAVGKAIEEAMKETLERLGERLSNATRLRS